MAHPLKLATPAEAVTVSPPVLAQLSTPVEGLLPMASVTLFVALVATFPLVSKSVTATGNVPVPVAWMFWPEVGWALKLRLVAVPPMMLKGLGLEGGLKPLE